MNEFDAATKTKKPDPRDRTERTEPTRSPQVFAVCPTNPKHKQAKVYRTDGRTRYCKCNDCGEFWKQIGPEATGKVVATP